MILIRIGLPKGRGLEFTRDVCSRLGIDVRGGQSRFETTWGQHRIITYILKFGDIASLLAADELDLGVTGEEWLLETGMLRERSAASPAGIAESAAIVEPAGALLSYVTIYQGRLCLLATAEPSDAGKLGVVASPYRHLAKRLTSVLDPEPRILAVYGTSEALVPAIADAALDVVESGRTARLHGLSVIADYGSIATCLVRSLGFDPNTAPELIALLQAEKS